MNMCRYLSFLLFLIALVIPTAAWEATVSQDIAITVTQVQTITAVNLANTNFAAGAPSGTVVGAITVTMSPSSPAFSGSLSLSGTNASSFQIVGTSLETNGVVAAGTYQINIIATQAGASGSPFSQPETITGSSSGDPTIGILPSDRSSWASWSNAGLNSIGGIPNRTTIYTTLSPNGTDDTTQLQTALDNCPANQVVKLAAGVFRITGNGVTMGTTNCTLRGAGPGHQLSTGITKVNGGGTVRSCVGSSPMTVGDATFCVDTTATQLIKADRATNPAYQVLRVEAPGGGYGTAINLASDAAQGAFTLTLASTPSPPITVGEIVQVDMNTDTDPDVFYGTDFCAGPPAACPSPPYPWPFYRPNDRSLSQIMEVTAVSGGTSITFNTPFHNTFKTAYQAQLARFTAPFLRKVGVEDLFIWGGMGGDYYGNIAMGFCAYCWIKNVEATYAVGTDIQFYATFRSVLRDSFIHESGDPNPGGGGYLTGLNQAASDNLFENNIMWSGNKEIVARASGGGNVIAYNYMDDSFGSGYPDQVEAGVNAGHFTTPHLELMEGNYSQNYKGDSFWGNSISLTVFRNWLSALRAARAPLNAYVNTGACYGDYYNRHAVDVQAHSYNTSFVGNVLGMSGQSLITSWPGGCTNETAQTQFLEQVTTTAQWNSASNANAVVMWFIGELQQNGLYLPQHAFVDGEVSTQLRQGNWDWVSGGQQWFGIGGTTHGSGTPVTIPSSFYLSSKPAFFGTHTWPWVDPTTGTTYTLPAKYCFEHNLMPTCPVP
jgi:hypothetical protein